MISIRRATEDDCHRIAPLLRADDVRELEASGSEPLKALLSGLKLSYEPLVGEDEHGKPLGMFGLCPSPDPLVGIIWLLGTDEIEKHPIAFLRRSREWLQDFHRKHPVLMNCVDERNRLHMKWLRWNGFTFIRRLHSPGGVPFIEFVRLRHV